jgi:hypothetical protein
MNIGKTMTTIADISPLYAFIAMTDDLSWFSENKGKSERANAPGKADSFAIASAGAE